MNWLHHTGRGCLLLALLSPGLAAASGFGLIEQSVSSMGNAHASGAAGSDDPSAMWFNPATMSRLEGTDFAAGVHYVKPDTKFKGNGRYNTSLPVIGGAPIAGGNGGEAGENALVPHAHFVHSFNQDWSVGIGVSVPFGLETEYDDDWVGRYHAVKSELLTVNINPAVAYRVNDKVSIGAGLNALYADAKLTNKVDVGASVGAPGASDGEAEVTGDDWGWGFNVGILLEPTERTRFGLAYRSGVDVTLEGDLDLSHPVVGTKDDAEADADLPGSASISLVHDLGERWSIMADLTWTDWSNLEELRVNFDNNPSSITDLKWDDTLRYSAGVSYRPNPQWTLRGGVAYDEGATPKASLRSPRIPDDDRLWVTLGASFRYSERLSFDVAYAHIFVDDPEISSFDARTPDTPSLHQIRGEYDASVDIVSAQANWWF